MNIIVDTIIIAICFFTMCQGAGWLVDSSARIARRLGVSNLVIGLTIVAFGTSAPELNVSILAAIRGAGDISVGNVIGSNIFNIGIILVGVAIVQNLKTDNEMIHRDGFFLMVVTIVSVAVLWDLRLTQFEGMVLFILLLFYLGNLYSSKRANREVELVAEQFRIRHIFLLLLSMAMLIGSSHYLVGSACNLARAFGCSEWLIGATILAAGTSLPGLITSIIAAMRGNSAISIGNLIGSDIFNVLGVLGLAGIIREMPIESSARISLLIYPIMVCVALVFLRTDWKLTRREGIVLVLFGLARWVYSIIAQ